VPEPDDRITSHACHIFMARLDPTLIGVDKMAFIKAMQAEGVPAHPGYTTPLYAQDFWSWFAQRPTGGGRTWGEVWPRSYDTYELPVCEQLCRTTIWIKQELLLAGPEAMGDIVAAFDKVAGAAREHTLPTG
jgi:dTDP-4-amino-4,6-dideoxygalactose transaminase